MQDKGSSGGGGGSSGDAGEELWIVGRVLDDMDIRLGAKQEKIRESLYLYWRGGRGGERTAVRHLSLSVFSVFDFGTGGFGPAGCLLQ